MRENFRLETNSKANPGNSRVLDVHETEPVRVQLFVERLVDDLDIGCRGEPMGDREIVVGLERILMFKPQAEALAQEGKERAAQLGARDTDPIAVIGATWNPFAADAREECPLDRIRISIGSAGG